MGSEKTERESFHTAATHQRLYPTLRPQDIKQELEEFGYESVPPKSTSKAVSKILQLPPAPPPRKHNNGALITAASSSAKSPQVADEFVAAQNNSPQLTQLLTTPPRCSDIGSHSEDVVNDLLGNSSSSSSRPTSVAFQQKRRSPTRQKSPLATSSSKAPHLLHVSSHNDRSSTKLVMGSIAPLPSAPPIDVVHSELLGKREPHPLPGKSSHPKKVKLSTPKQQASSSSNSKGQSLSMKGSSQQLGSQKVKVNSSSTSLPRQLSSPGKSLSEAFTRATGTVIGKLLQARRPSL